MCDDVTEAENEAASARSLGRRDFARLGLGAATVAALPGCSSDGAMNAAVSPDASTPSAKPEGSPPLPSASTSTASATDASGKAAAATVSRRVDITTPDGKADAFFVAPREGKHPAVVMWPDIAGLRKAYETMGTLLAEQGYAVLVVNQYYRSAAAPVLASFAEWRSEAGKAKLKPMIDAISPEVTARDATAFVAWLDTQPEVDTRRRIGSCGYCMGGPFAIRTAASSPSRVGAAASFHGANLVNDKPDSPHLLLAKTQAAFLVVIAKNDDERDATAKVKLREAADAAKRPAEIEVYPAQHGFCTIDAPVYDKEHAERAWSRMLTTFKTAL